MLRRRNKTRVRLLCHSIRTIAFGGLAQLARAPALQAGGQRFESVILHSGKKENIDILEAKSGSCPDKFIGEPVKSKDTGTATTKRANQTTTRIKSDRRPRASGRPQVICRKSGRSLRAAAERRLPMFHRQRKTERRKGHMKDALALGGEEGRDKLR